MKTLLLLALLAAQTPTDVQLVPPDTPSADVVTPSSSAAPGPTVVVDEGVVVERAALPPGDTVIITDTFRDLVNVIANWRAVTALGVAAALIALLMRLSKLGVLYTFLEARKLGWLRPWLAALLGGAGAVVTVLTGGVRDLPGLISAFVGGALAGWTGAGGYDALRTLSPEERDKKRVSTSTITTLNNVAEKTIRDAEREALGVSGPVKAAVAAAADLPPHKRAEAIAAQINKPVRP